MLERGGNLRRSVFIDLVAVEIGDDDAMQRTRIVYKPVSLSIESQPPPADF